MAVEKYTYGTHGLSKPPVIRIIYSLIITILRLPRFSSSARMLSINAYYWLRQTHLSCYWKAVNTILSTEKCFGQILVILTDSYYRKMAHTVIWMATVYFTAFVGCAFSSPRRTAENSQDDAITVAILENESENTEKASATDTVMTTIGTTVETFDSLQYDSGGTNETNSSLSNQQNSTTETMETSSDIINSTERDSGDLVSTKKDLDKESNKTERLKKISHKAKSKKGCPTCKTWKEVKQDIENRHREAIKAQLLDKLRMAAPPVAVGSYPALPMKELERTYLSDQGSKKRRRAPQNFYAKTVRVFVMGKDETHDCSHKKNAGCYYFNLGDKVSPNDLFTAELWIYKLFNHNDPYIQTFIVSELDRGNHSNKRRPRNIVKRVETKLKHGWLKIDVKRSVLRWLQKPDKNDGISILCKGCQRRNYRTIFSTKKDTMPFIVITTRKGYRSRKARSLPIRCTSTTTRCCLAPLEIDFQDIGWTAIIAPRKLRTNYCTGSCHERYASYGNHTQLIQAHRWSVANADQMKELTPCCSPISYAPQSLMYRDHLGEIRAVVVPNIQATACGCL